MKKLLGILLLSVASSAFAASPYIGGSVGYLVDSQDVYVAGHLGVDLSKVETLLHGVELEIGYAHESEYGANADIVPVGLRDNGWAFTVQTFAGVEFKATEKISFKAGARYLWIDEVKLFSYRGEVGDDVALELGVRCRF